MFMRRYMLSEQLKFRAPVQEFFAKSSAWPDAVCVTYGGAEVSLWMQTGDRQSSRLRSMYLKALLRQDIGYFDTDTSTGDFVSSIASDPLMVQDAISEKVTNPTFQEYTRPSHEIFFLHTESFLLTHVVLCGSSSIMQIFTHVQVGNFIHYMSTFVTGFIVGFTELWQIALVTLAIVPLIAISGGFYAWSLTTSTARQAHSYSEAGSIAEQVKFVLQLRT
jgi:ATP-binding cassette subfamily B (MDR/TAP) protein 1